MAGGFSELQSASLPLLRPLNSGLRCHIEEAFGRRIAALVMRLAGQAWLAGGYLLNSLRKEA